MTTLISLPTKDCIVIGCDSLATSTQVLLDPFKLASVYFDEEGKLRLDEDGNPLLDNGSKLFSLADWVPRNQVPNVTKLFSLSPIKAGLLFSGVSGVGRKSIGNLLDDYRALDSWPLMARAPLSEVASNFGAFIQSEFDSAMREIPVPLRPSMEIILSGYSPYSRNPEVYRVNCGPELRINSEIIDGELSIVLGGQFDVIQRVVNGIDLQAYASLSVRSELILNNYRDLATNFLTQSGIQAELPLVDTKNPALGLFSDDFGGVKRIVSELGTLSEQAAIDFVKFLIDTMIRAQEFSDQLPTVGGDIHIALLRPSYGFRWISREEYTLGNHSVSKYE